MNWPAYDASLRQRGSLAVRFSDEAVAAWTAELGTTPGGHARYSALAILAALTLRTVFRRACRQAEGLLGLALHVPDRATLSRRAATLEVPRSSSAGAGAGGEPRLRRRLPGQGARGGLNPCWGARNGPPG